MITTVYALHRSGIPFYVGCTTDTRRRAKAHYTHYGFGTVLVPLAAYSTIKAGYSAEVIAWESLTRLGHPIENKRPSGLPTAFFQRTSEQCAEHARRTERLLTPEQRKARARSGALAANATRVTCPECDFTSSPGAVGMHRKGNHRS